MSNERLPKLKQRRCHHCGGTGLEADPAEIGSYLKQQRIRAEITLRAMAGKLGISEPYLCQLEKGVRDWPEGTIADYLQNLKAPA